MYSSKTTLPLLNMDCVSMLRVYVNVRVGDVTNPEGSSCSSYQSFVVVLSFKSKYLPLNFERCNFDNVVYAQTATLHTN